jgi:hypothetical protein
MFARMNNQQLSITIEGVSASDRARILSGAAALLTAGANLNVVAQDGGMWRIEVNGYFEQPGLADWITLQQQFVDLAADPTP